jgi:Leucine-rich repeat (LRR) protein
MGNSIKMSEEEYQEIIEFFDGKLTKEDIDSIESLVVGHNIDLDFEGQDYYEYNFNNDSFSIFLEKFKFDFLTFPNLKVLNILDDRIYELPEEVSYLKSLEKLDLSTCECLKDISYEIGELSNLKILNLSHCEYLKRIPSEIGELSNLKILNLSHCEYLKRIPSEIGELSNLEKLDLSRCEYLKYIPDEIGELSNLKILDLSSCERLRELPSSIGNLTNLEELNLGGTDIETIPPEILELEKKGCKIIRPYRMI